MITFLSDNKSRWAAYLECCALHAPVTTIDEPIYIPAPGYINLPHPHHSNPHDYLRFPIVFPGIPVIPSDPTSPMYPYPPIPVDQDPKLDWDSNPWVNYVVSPYTYTQTNVLPWPWVYRGYRQQEAYAAMIDDIVANATLNDVGDFDSTTVLNFYYIYMDALDDIQDTYLYEWAAKNVADELPACVADWNGDNGVDGGDISAFYNDWSNGAADVNGDGGTDGDDVTLFYEMWADSACF